MLNTRGATTASLVDFLVGLGSEWKAQVVINGAVRRRELGDEFTIRRVALITGAVSRHDILLANGRRYYTLAMLRNADEIEWRVTRNAGGNRG